MATHCRAHHHEFSLTPNLIDGLSRVAWHADEPFAKEADILPVATNLDRHDRGVVGHVAIGQFRRPDDVAVFLVERGQPG